MSGAERQRRYREREQQRNKQLIRRMLEHHFYRVQINVILAHIHRDAAWLARVTGVAQQLIEIGYEDNYGMFRQEEIAAIRSALPQAPTPRS